MPRVKKNHISSRHNTAMQRILRSWAVLIVVGIAIGLVLEASCSAYGQSITAPAQQAITHDGTDTSQVFSEVVWQLNSGLDAGGYTTQLSCGPFVHSGAGTFKVDSKLALRILVSEGSAKWTVTVPNDQTNFSATDETAVVAAQSSAVGDGQVGLTVTFLDSDFSLLAAGNYTLTVTGTITAN